MEKSYAAVRFGGIALKRLSFFTGAALYQRSESLPTMAPRAVTMAMAPTYQMATNIGLSSTQKVA